MEKEIKLIIKNDNYKAIKNFIHNDLGVTKIELEEMVGNYVKSYIEKGDLTESVVEKKIADLVGDTIRVRYGYGLRGGQTIKDKIDQNIDKLVCEAIDRRLEKIIKEIAEDMVREKLSIPK